MMEGDGAHRRKRLKTVSTQDKDFVNYFSELPTLQRITTVSIAIRLCTAPDVKSKIISSNDPPGCSELEEKVFNRLLNSSLPDLLKTDILHVIRPIKSLLFKWLQMPRVCRGYSKQIRDFYIKGGSICWTIEGTIDVMQPLKELCNNENSEDEICSLFEAATLFCLEEYASVLWGKIPVQKKRLFKIARLGDDYNHHIYLYWVSALEDKLDGFLNSVIRIDHKRIYDPNLSIDLNMISCAVRDRNVFALKYFWKKLTEQEKVANLNKWLLQAARKINNVNSSDCHEFKEFQGVLCFLLSHVSSKTELAEFFQDHPSLLLLLFKSWPFQRIFLPTILDVLDYLQEDVYVSLIKDIGLKLNKEGVEMKIFKEMWSGSPSRLKRSFFKKEDTCSTVMLHLLEIEDSSMALVLLSDALEEERRRIVSHMFGMDEFREYLNSTKYFKLLCALLSETTLPPDCNLDTFKRTDEDQQDVWYGNWHLCYEWIHDGNFQIVDKFLKWAFQSVEEIKKFKKNKLNPYEIYICFITMCNYERIDQFMNWYFETKEEMEQFKKDFLLEDNNSHFRHLLHTFCSKPDIKLDELEKFMSFSQTFFKEILEYRLICLDCVEFVLKLRGYELATVFLNRSLESIDEVKRYKNDFVLSENGVLKYELFNKLGNYNDWRHIKDMIEWSSPLSIETVTELKSVILEQEASYSCDHELNLKVTEILNLLDSSVESRSNHGCHHSTNVGTK